MDKYVEEFSQDLRNLNLSELEILDVIIDDIETYLIELKHKRSIKITENLSILYACNECDNCSGLKKDCKKN